MKENKYYDIIILDTGINLNHQFFLGNNNIESIKLFIDKKTGKINHKKSKLDSIGHGTAVTSIIEKNSPDTKKLVVNFYDMENSISENLLYSVLEYIYENINGAVINLSFGVNFCENRNILHDVCKKLTNKGFIIVAAMGSEGNIVYPAAFPEIISVATDRYITKFSDYVFFDKDDILNIATFGINLRLPWCENNEYKMVSGSSFSCAYMTTIVSNLYKSGFKSIDEIKNMLKIKSKRIIPFKDQIHPLCKENMFKIKKAILFPFNKEMHSMVRYNDSLDFEIVGIYDVTKSLKVGMTTNQLMSDQNVKTFIVQNYNKINWENFDTLIIGHCDELELRTGDNNILQNILDSAIKHKKQVYSFDNIKTLIPPNVKSIEYPQITERNLPPKRMHMLFSIGTPVVGIFGTGSQQGKFTLQLEIRKRMIDIGYDVGQIGTEPNSLLHGMDYMYPIGYNCSESVFLHEENVIKYLNYLLYKLDCESKDIILVGSQGGTIPDTSGNLMEYGLRQSAFLKATWPDVVILCINFDDDIYYIKRTIVSIESTIDCKVIAIAFLPFSNSNNAANLSGNYKRKLIDNESILKKKALFENEFALKSFLINNSKELDELVDLMIENLS